MGYNLNSKFHVLKNGNERVTSDYGYRSFTYKGKKYAGFHHGIDLISKKYGTDYIIAFENGIVTAVGNKVTGYSESSKSGNYIYIRHDNGYQTRYLHLKKDSMTVKVGDNVTKGQVIAFMGSTGFSTGNHLHFEVRYNGSSENPKEYLLGSKNIISVSYPINNTDSTKYKIGDEVIFTGTLYRDSYGNGPGAVKKNFKAIITLINNNSKCPYNINNGLGWVRREDIKPVSDKAAYKIKKGDTLWGIAKKYYGNGNKYKVIAEANEIKPPYIIYPNQIIIIPRLKI